MLAHKPSGLPKQTHPSRINGPTISTRNPIKVEFPAGYPPHIRLEHKSRNYHIKREFHPYFLNASPGKTPKYELKVARRFSESGFNLQMSRLEDDPSEDG